MSWQYKLVHESHLKKTWKKQNQPHVGKSGFRAKKKLALFRGHLLFILGK